MGRGRSKIVWVFGCLFSCLCLVLRFCSALEFLTFMFVIFDIGAKNYAAREGEDEKSAALP